MGLTLVEKIAARHADGLAPGTQVRSGDFVSIRPRHVMTHDNTGAVIPKFKQIGATTIADPARIWATGVTWWQVPKVAKVLLKGNLSAGVTGKDVIIALCGLFNKDEVLNHAVEFLGDGATNLPMSARMTIANMTTEWGALAGVFPFDDVTVNYLRSRVGEFTNPKRPGTRGPKG